MLPRRSEIRAKVNDYNVTVIATRGVLIVNFYDQKDNPMGSKHFELNPKLYDGRWNLTMLALFVAFLQPDEG